VNRICLCRQSFFALLITRTAESAVLSGVRKSAAPVLGLLGPGTRLSTLASPPHCNEDHRDCTAEKEIRKLKASLKTIRPALLRMSERLRGNALAEKYASAEPPLRSELFSADQMQRHGKTLADSHTVGQGRGPDQLLARLVENEGVLVGTYNLLRRP